MLSLQGCCLAAAESCHHTEYGLETRGAAWLHTVSCKFLTSRKTWASDGASHDSEDDSVLSWSGCCATVFVFGAEKIVAYLGDAMGCPYAFLDRFMCY